MTPFQCSPFSVLYLGAVLAVMTALFAVSYLDDGWAGLALTAVLIAPVSLLALIGLVAGWNKASDWRRLQPDPIARRQAGREAIAFGLGFLILAIPYVIL